MRRILLLLMVVSYPLFATDLKPDSVLLPKPTTYSPFEKTWAGITPSFIVENANVQPATSSEYTVVVDIRTQTGTEVYRHTVQGKTILPFTKQTLTSDLPWFPTASGRYSIRLTVIFASDILPQNNIKEWAFSLCAGPQPQPAETEPGLVLVELAEGASGTVTFSTGIEPCCWNLTAAPPTGNSAILKGMSPSSGQCAFGKNLTFSFTSATGAFQGLMPFIDEMFADVYITIAPCDNPTMTRTEIVRILVKRPADPIASAPTGATIAEIPNSGTTNDPIATLTGELYDTPQPDIEIFAPTPLVFKRWYATRLDSARTLGAKPLGANWSHSYLYDFKRFGNRIFLTTPQGNRFVFRAAGGMWSAPTGLEKRVSLTAQDGVFYVRDTRMAHLLRFDSTGRLTGIYDKHGRETKVFGASGRVDSLRDGFGNSLVLSYDGSGNLTSVRDNAGRIARYSVVNGELVSFTNCESMVYTYEYSAGKKGHLSKMMYPEGNSPYVQQFDALGRTVKQTPALGQPLDLEFLDTVTTLRVGSDGAMHTHDKRGNMVKFTDQTGASVTTGFSTTEKLSSIQDRRGADYSAEYDDATGMMKTLEFPEGEDFSFEYHVRRLFGLPYYEVTKATDATGKQHIFEYNSGGYLTGYSTLPPSVKYALEYSAAGLMEKMTKSATGLQQTTTYLYGAKGLPTQVSVSGQGAHLFEYDAAGRVIKHTLPNGKARLYEYSALFMKSMTDEKGMVTRYEYDKNGRMHRMTRDGEVVLSLTFDAMNRIVTATGGEGKTWRRSFDSQGRIDVVIGPDGDSLRMKYDKTGKPMSMTDATGHTWGIGADGEGITGTITSPSGAKHHYATDSLGRVIGQYVPGGASRTIRYDNAGRPITLGDEFGRRTTIVYSGDSKPISLTLNDSLALGITYSEAGRMTRMTDPLGSQWDFLHTGAGLLSGYRDPLQHETSLERDSEGRISKVRFPGNTGTVSLAYTADGRIASQAASDGDTLIYTYTSAGLVSTATGFTAAYDKRDAMIGSNGITIERDGDRRITAITPSTGKRIDYQYDKAGRLMSIRDWSGGSITMGYDAGGRLIGMNRANGINTSMTLDSAGRLTALREGSIASLDIKRDASGLIRSAERRYPSVAKVGSVEVATSYDAASRMTPNDYNARGTTLRDAERSYTWDAFGRLRTITRGGLSTEYKYDASGHCISRIESGDTVNYRWNYATTLPSLTAEISKGIEKYTITTPDGMPVMMIDAAGKHVYYHYDEQGNTTLLTDEAGTVVGSFAYSPFGEILAQHASVPQGNFLYRGSTGNYTDKSNNICFMQSRWYDPATGRFLSRDSKVTPHPNESNPYSYARNNPMLYYDPMGTDARVNIDGIHTDISVDVWSGNTIIGTLNVSWGDGGGAGAASGARFMNALSTNGALKVTFIAGNTINSEINTIKTDYVWIYGTRQQDDNLLKGIIEYVESISDPTRAGDQKQLTFLQNITDPTTYKKIHHGAVTAEGFWSEYRFFTNSCNDVTDHFLDVYFGENWYFGSIYDSGSMEYNLRKYILANSVPLCGTAVYVSDRASYLFFGAGAAIDAAKGVIFGLVFN